MMYKVSPVFHAGIEFVQLSKLPAKQAEQIVNRIPGNSLIKIQVGEELLEDCISYDDYENFYHLIGYQNYDKYFESQL
ncbi:hypothetical protein ACFLU5_11000 [Bacteroidota bacterium]